MTMNEIRITRSAIVHLTIALALAGNSGCGTPKTSESKPPKLFSLDNSWPWGDDEPEEGTPVRVVGAWTDTVLTQPGQAPQRGFGGRLMFYGSENEKPILVDGQLVVYAFDETGREPTDNKPTRRYVFPADQIPRHMSKSDLGVAYSFWLPWDDAGGARTEVSLICRFEPKVGSVVTGEQTRHLLPGTMESGTGITGTRVTQLPEGVPSRPARPTLESLQSSRRSDSGAQQASYESPADPRIATAKNLAEPVGNAPDRQMTVTSIALPHDFQLPGDTTNRRAGSTPTGTLPVFSQSQPQPAPMQQQAQPIQQQPAAASIQTAPANQGIGATPFQAATAPRQIAPAMQPVANGFGTLPTMRPQLITPQFMTTQFGQPASAATGNSNIAPAVQMSMPPQQQQPLQPMQQMPAQTGVTTTVSYPSPGTLPQRPGG